MLMKDQLIILILYFGLIFFNMYECYKIQKKFFFSLIASFILVTASFIYVILWLWIFATLLTNPLNLTGWILYPLNIIIGIIVTIGGIFLCIPFWRLYDNFKDLGIFTFKKKIKK
jgi:hypothetical protein